MMTSSHVEQVMDSFVTVEIESVRSPDAKILIEQLSNELAPRYPDSRKGGAGFRPADMDIPGACFVVARADGVAVGCGAIRPFDEEPGVAEVKRMFVQPAHRGRGLSRRILAKLEEAAKGFGYRTLVLETGDKQMEAIGLYEKSGFKRCDCWGEYIHSGWSLCYRKDI
jgi:GNAT superfamily N-acetyltransferase